MADLARFNAAVEAFLASGAADTEKGQAAVDALAQVLEDSGVAYGSKPLAAAGTPRGETRSMPARMAAVSGRASSGPEIRPSRTRATITAAAPSKIGPAGSPLSSSAELAEVICDVLTRLQSSHDFNRTLVATARWDYPEDRQLDDSDSAGNGRKLDAVCGIGAPRYNRQGALVATGGICLPVGVDYTIPTWATADRPLRDGLPAFQATRGGIRYVSPPDIGIPTLQGGTASGAGTATTIWTEANDANPTTPPTKPVWTVACGTEQLVYVNAIPTRVKFGNMQARFQPEMVAANTEVAMSVAAREAELELLTLMYSASKQIAPKQFLGATRNILSTADLLASQYRYSHRIPESTTLTAVLPAWAKSVVRADLARELAHDNATGGRDVLGIADGEIESWFSMRGINLIWTIDGLQGGTYGAGSTAITNQYFGIANAGAQPQWPGQSADGAFMLAWLLFAEGSFQFLDGGRLDLGVVRDSQLDATNDWESFTEVFEGVAMRGLEAFQVQSMILPDGTSAAGTTATYHE
jgi:hypothetical protein